MVVQVNILRPRRGIGPAGQPLLAVRDRRHVAVLAASDLRTPCTKFSNRPQHTEFLTPPLFFV
jgi:hypothetical protein